MSSIIPGNVNAHCRYCSGTGTTPTENAKPVRQDRSPLKRMIPYGNDVSVAISMGRMILSPLLMVSDEPIRDDSGRIIAKRSRWDIAKDSQALGRPIMVLPSDTEVDSFSWPKIPHEYQKFWPCCLLVWAWDLSNEQCGKLGESLVLAGFDSVSILDKQRQLLSFKVG